MSACNHPPSRSSWTCATLGIVAQADSEDDEQLMPQPFLFPDADPAAPLRCHYCDEPAEYLCDFNIVTEAEKKALLTSGASRDQLVAGLVKPCSRPICKTHRVNRGSFHLCGRGRHGPGCRIETIDYCPDHAD